MRLPKTGDSVLKSAIAFIDNSNFVRAELAEATTRKGLPVEHISLNAFLRDETYELPENACQYVIPASLGSLKDTFALVHKLSIGRQGRIIVHPSTRLPGPTILDLQDRGCLVLPPVPSAEQFIQALDVADASEQRIARRGVVLKLQGSDDPWVLGPYGGEQRYRLGTGRQRPMFFRMVESIGSAVSLATLADSINGNDNEVKTYVMRLRSRYEALRRKLHLRIAKSQFIEETGKGYRLNAQIK